MAKDAGHRNGTISPWWIKCEIELVVLDVLITSDIMLELDMRRIYDIAGLCFNLTVWTCPPERCWATDFAIEGFSATQRILGAMRRQNPWPDRSHASSPCVPLKRRSHPPVGRV